MIYMNETISVLIPMFNRQEFIADAINSIRNQLYNDISIIVYDDGSTDNSVQIVKDLMNKDNRITLIEGKINKGVGHARNKLLMFCTTKYAVWQDSDDIADQRKIDLQFKFQKQLKKDTLIFTRWVWIYKLGKTWEKRIKNSDKPGFATLMFPVKKHILFDETLILGGEDWNWIEKMQKECATIEIEDEILYYVRSHEDRIGQWKRKTKLNQNFPKELLTKLSYKEILEYYKKHYE